MNECETVHKGISEVGKEGKSIANCAGGGS